MKNSRQFFRHIIRALALMMILLSLTTCIKHGHKKSPKIDPGFSNYIAAFTSGVISSESSIKIRLAADYPKANVDGNPVSERLFRFDPNITGKLYWLDKRTLEFRPAANLPSGTVFDCDFLLSKLIDVPSKFKTLKFQFQTIQQSFAVTNEGLFIVNTGDPGHYLLKGKVQTADVMTAGEVEKLVMAKLGSEQLHLAWSHDQDRKNHHFQADSIVRKDNAREVELSWDGKTSNVKINGKTKIEIPALNDFKVIRIKVNQAPEQYVEVGFSDLLNSDQVLDGLIRIANRNDMKFSIENNILKIFPKERMTGKMMLDIDASVRNNKGSLLSKSFSTEISFEDVKPGVRLTGKGVILPNSNGLILPFEAVNLKKVDLQVIKIFENNIAQFLQVNTLENDYELKRVGKVVYQEEINLMGGKVIDFGKWNTFSIDLTNLIDKDPGAIYHVIFGFKKEYSLYTCNEAVAAENEMEKIVSDTEEENTGEGEMEPEEGYYNDYYPAGYNWRERENPCHVSFYTSDRFVKRNILASDLGIIAKAGSKNTMLVAVTDLRSTEPLNDVQIELYDYQNQIINKGQTARDGMTNIEYKEKPYLLVARKGKQRGYLRVDDATSLSLSKFDVSGAVVQKGIKGFIYGERGVWRPGDTLFLTFILEDKNKLLPGKHPVSLELQNPRGQVYTKLVSNESTGGFYKFIIPTESNVPTGNWTATARIGGAWFTKNIKIETVKPNRLKIKVDFGDKMLSSKKEVNGKLNTSWLTGAVARNLKAVVTATFNSTRTVFDHYKDYTFDDPAKKFDPEEQTIFEGRVNENGEARITGKINIQHASPGLLKANFMVRVFEESGDFSSDFFSTSYSPYTSYVGIHVPKGDKNSGMLSTGETHTIDIATVDEAGNPVSRNNLEVNVYKVNWRWWWNASDEDLATYEGEMANEPVKDARVSTVAGKGSFTFRVENQDWGRYLIRVKDPSSGHTAGHTVYLDWPYWSSGNRNGGTENATMLNFSSDKNAYKVGEMVTVTIPTGSQGRALLSIESGSRVLEAYWVEAKEKETVVKFKATPEMTPNVYVHVTLVQPHAQTVNDLPIRLYGIIPLSIEDPSTVLHPLLEMPATLKPEQTATLKIREEKGRAMSYTIAIVDEGLLDLTRFKTPNPWETFYAREALGIKTWDMFDLVLGAYGGKLEQVFAIGGDRDQVVGNPKKANRFKPMVIYLGPFDLKAGGTGTHVVKIPQYIGSVRAMVVAGRDGAYGSTEKTVPVKKPLMVLATLPRVVGPGESVKLPVTVFAMEKTVKDVKVDVIASNMFALNGGKTKSVTFKVIGDQVLNFDLKVLEKLGPGKVKVVATSGNEKAVTEIEIDVRNPNPPITDFIEKAIDGRSSWSADYKYVGMDGTNKITLEVSSLLPADFNRRLEWLIQYPHGCIEQTTSAGFPQLFLEEVVNIDKPTADRIQRNVKATLQKLKSFQLPSGGFAYWPGGYQADEWGSSYAGHFLLEAEARGYSLPVGMKENWIKYQNAASGSWSPRMIQYTDDYSWYDFVQAYRLFTLALAKAPNMAAMNRLKELKNLTPEARCRLAAAYQLAGQANVAKELVWNYKMRTKESREMYEIYGSLDRDKAMALETMVILGDKARAFSFAKDLADDLKKEYWMSTQTTAYSLLALSKYLKMAGGSAKMMEFSYTSNNDKVVGVKSSKAVFQVNIPVKTAKGGKIKIENPGGSLLYARIVMTGTPLNGDQRITENNLKLDIAYHDMKGKPIDISKVEQGTDFYAEVSVSNPGLIGYYKNLALTQIFPSGWEIINLRLADMTAAKTGGAPTYQDIRDDRTYTYFDLGAGQSKKFIVMLNAAYLGEYYLSGPYCEAMYDNRINARKAGKWVKVVGAAN